MESAQSNKITQIYSALVHYYFKEGQREPDFDDKPFINLLDILFPIVREHKYFDDDLYMFAIITNLNSLKEIPDSFEGLVDQLIQHIFAIFDINKDVHYLIFPLQGSGLKNDINFSNFHFLTCKKELLLIKQISTITGIEISAVKDFLQHTKTSRSPDFLKDNILIIKIENQTSYVNRRSYRIAQHIIYFLYTIHIGYGMESSIFREAEGFTQDNSHVAILSQDGWRCGHGFDWNAHLKCKIDIDFLTEERYQSLFCKLYTAFEIGEDADELTNKFLNALILVNRGLQQRKTSRDDSLALLLYLTAAESLLTESQQEKRLRLSATLSRIVSIDGFSSANLAKNIDKLYRKRNNFVHAGEISYFSYEDDALKILEQAVAQLVLKYFEIDLLIKKEPGELRSTAWNKYVDNMFNDIIFSDCSTT